MTVLPAGSVVGDVTAPWREEPVPIVTTRALSGLVMAGIRIALSSHLLRLAGSAVRRGEQIGTLSATGITGTSSTGLAAARSGSGAGVAWRLTRL